MSSRRFPLASTVRVGAVSGNVANADSASGTFSFGMRVTAYCWPFGITSPHTSQRRRLSLSMKTLLTTRLFEGPLPPRILPDSQHDRDRITLMPIDQVVSLLIAERDRLHRAIQILQDGGAKRRGRPPKNSALNHPSVADDVKPASATTPVHRKRTMSAAGRKAIRDGVRKRWALIRAGKVASPFAKRTRKSKKTAKAA